MTDEFAKTSILVSDTYRDTMAQAGDAPASLVLLVGPENQMGRQWPIADQALMIGRSMNTDIHVDDDSVSGIHAKVCKIDGELTITDLDSTNQTFVNGTPLKPQIPHKLAGNDLIKMGNVVVKFLECGSIESVAMAHTFDRSHVDAMTKLHNKGALMIRGVETFTKSVSLNLPMGVVTFDIDHFKRVNDTYGHAAGDYILTEFARVSNAECQAEDDFLARSGGEEFTLLALGPLQKIQDEAETLRQAVEDHHFVFDGKEIPITISIGISMKDERDSNWLEILQRADKALYLSKENGRNQVTVGP